MDYSNLIISVVLLFSISFIFNKYKINVEKDDKIDELNIVKKYLLNKQDFTIEQLSAIRKPIIWIHLDYTINSRKWESFGSRNSNELNQDYIYLTLRSIINKCSDNFHVVLIDDDSFKRLLDDWTVDLNMISNPHKEYVRTLALAKILYNYGGLLIEPSLVLFKSLKPIYDKVLETEKMCVAEFPNESSNAHVMNYMPSTKFIGCKKNCPNMHEFGKHLEVLVNLDYTNEINIEDLINKWLLSKIQSSEINYIDGKYLGIKDINGKAIGLDNLVGSNYIDLNLDCYCLYIPRNDLLKRINYKWFVYLSTAEVLESSTNIGKYLLLSNS